MLARSPCDESAIRSASAAACAGQHRHWTLIASILGSSLVFIDGSVVNVVLPVIQGDMRATALDVQWIVVGYALFLSALMLVGGSLGDHYGRRKIFLVGVVIFAVASACCGLAPGARLLIAARALQGVGSALLAPNSLAIIAAAYDEAGRGRAIAMWSSFTAVMAALGPALGGWLTDHASWRWVFFINLPITVAVIAVALLRVPESRDEETVHRVDWLGAVACTAGLGFTAYALMFSSVLGWTSFAVIGALAVGLGALGAFVAIEARSKAPLMPLELFADRTFSGINAMTLLLYAALSAVMFFVPFDLIQVQRYSPTAAGFAFIPFIATIFLLSRFSPRLMERFGRRLPLIFGPCITALGSAGIALIGVGGSYWTTFFPALLVVGIGMAIAIAPLTDTVMESAGPERLGVASGINNSVSRVAGLLAVAGFGALVLSIFSGGLDRRLRAMNPPPAIYQRVMQARYALADAANSVDVGVALRPKVHAAVIDAYMTAFRWAMVLAGALAALSALVCALTVGDRRTRAATASRAP